MSWIDRQIEGAVKKNSLFVMCLNQITYITDVWSSMFGYILRSIKVLLQPALQCFANAHIMCSYVEYHDALMLNVLYRANRLQSRQVHRLVVSITAMWSPSLWSPLAEERAF